MLVRRMMIGLGAAMTGGLLAFGTIPAQASVHRTELHAALHGSHAFPRAAGHATFEIRNDGRELDVRVSHIARLAGKRLVVFVHGARAGTMTVTMAGTAHLDRHGVPATKAGQMIRVRTNAAGTLVASGTFHRDN
ncbi:MAG TPA: hypothetical protein VGI64_13950 [Streptosporangiaceae bacterium]